LETNLIAAILELEGKENEQVHSEIKQRKEEQDVSQRYSREKTLSSKPTVAHYIL
jgi:hypothetical protein